MSGTSYAGRSATWSRRAGTRAADHYPSGATPASPRQGRLTFCDYRRRALIGAREAASRRVLLRDHAPGHDPPGLAVTSQLHTLTDISTG